MTAPFWEKSYAPGITWEQRFMPRAVTAILDEAVAKYRDRPMLVVYARWDDVDFPPAFDAARVARRYFGGYPSVADFFFRTSFGHLVLTPAAYHRQAEPGRISRRFASVAGLSLMLALIPMMLGIVLDVYVISMLVTGSSVFSVSVTAVLLLGYIGLWFVFPYVDRRAR